MRDYTKVSTSIWRSQKFKELEGDEKARLLYFYMLTNPHVNSAGCYDLPIAYALEDLKWTDIAYTEAMAAIMAVDLIAYDRAETTVLIVNWVPHNPPTNAKHAINMLLGLSHASSKRLRMVRGREIDAHVRTAGYDQSNMGGAQLRQRLIPYRAPLSDGARIASVTETVTKTVTGTETKTETETLTEASAKNSAPPTAALPTGAQSALGGSDDDIPDRLRTNLLMSRRV